MTKIGKTKLRMSSGKIRKFQSEEARDRYERVAQAIKHGWKPTKKGTGRGKGRKSSRKSRRC